VPELKTYFRKLLDNKDKLQIECKLSGVPIYPSDEAEYIIQRLVAVQEFKVRKLLKDRLRSEEEASNILLNQASGESGGVVDLSQNKDYQMT